MSTSSASYTSLNEALEILAQIAESRGEQYRASAFRRARIIPSLAGRSIAQKIEEYNTTGHIKELDELLSNPEAQAYLCFNRMLGFGPSSIRVLIRKRIFTREQLHSAVVRGLYAPTREQVLGLAHYCDLQKQIPRSAAARIGEIVMAEIFRVASRIGEIGNQVIVNMAGSYRRGANMLRDIDIIVALPEHNQRAPQMSKYCVKHVSNDVNDIFLHQVSEQLKSNAQYIDTVMLGNQRFSFLFKYLHVVLVDVIRVPRASYYAALLYFTGSRTFNIWLREVCKQRGYKLNQYGLHKKETKESIILESEQHIFDILNIPYIPPQNRENPPEYMPAPTPTSAPTSAQAASQPFRDLHP